MEIVWTERSILRFEEIGSFIAANLPNRAANFIDSVIKSVERLREFSHSGALCIENPAFRQIVVQSYRIIYRIKERLIEIITSLSPGLQSKL